MKSLIQTALILALSIFLSNISVANESLDQLLNKIDADIAASRLSNPVGNNAIEKIWQFKAIAPFDQRINSRTIDVGAFYVKLANQAIPQRTYLNAQIYLDKAWMLAYLTPGLENAQDSLDKVYKSSGTPNVAKRVSKPAPVTKPAAVAKVAVKKDNIAAKKDNIAAKKAKQKKQLAAAKLAKKKADKQAALRRKDAKVKEQRLAKLRADEQAKNRSTQKLAALEARRKLTAQPVRVLSKSIADFNLDQNLIDNRETSSIRSALGPICKEIIDNEASVVLNTRNKQDYRWLTVRLTLCVRRLDKGFRLRHSHRVVADAQPSISLHPGRNTSLLQQSRG
jgi:colicin import membrane protein